MAPTGDGIGQQSLSRRGFGALVVAGVALSVAACSTAGRGGGLTIAYQPNFGYAPLMILKHKRWVEERLSDVEVTYKQVNSGGLIRSGMIAGEIQVGAMALSPFLVGWDNGVDWKILGGLSDIDQWLMVKDSRLTSLADFTSSDKIAVLSADNNQAILLHIAARRQLGDANALAANEVFMPQDTGVQSLLSDRAAAHFTNPPYQFQERDRGARRILGSYDIFGGPEHSPMFGATVVRQSYFDDNPASMDALRSGLARSTEFLRSDPAESAAILAAEFGAEAATIGKYLDEPAVTFSDEVKGVQEMAQAMQEVGVIKRLPASDDDIIF